MSSKVLVEVGDRLEAETVLGDAVAIAESEAVSGEGKPAARLDRIKD